VSARDRRLIDEILWRSPTPAVEFENLVDAARFEALLWALGRCRLRDPGQFRVTAFLEEGFAALDADWPAAEPRKNQGENDGETKN